MNDKQRTDAQILINHCVDFAEIMLNDGQEFYPFAATIDFDNNLAPTSYYDGNEFPLSQDLIDTLLPKLEQYLNEKIKRSFAICYDVKVKSNQETDSQDAIAIRIKHSDSLNTIIYYYAYIIKDNKVEHKESWGEIQE